MKKVLNWLARPGVQRTLQHAAQAFLTGFAATLTATVTALNGPIDTKAIVSVVVGAAMAGGVAVFRALFPPAAQTVTADGVHLHVDTTALAKVISQTAAKVALADAAKVAASAKT